MYNDFLSASPEGCFLRRHTHARPRGYKKPPTPWNKICLNICLAPGYTSFLPLKTHFFFLDKIFDPHNSCNVKVFFFSGCSIVQREKLLRRTLLICYSFRCTPPVSAAAIFLLFFLIKNEAAFMRPRPQLKIVRV